MQNFNLVLLLLVSLFYPFAETEGALAGGRPNSVSGGQNAFAGIANPANAVWIPDRFDVGGFWVHQESTVNNHNDNPLFLPGKICTSYKEHDLYNFDAAINKRFTFQAAAVSWEASLSLATYSAPNRLAVRTKKPIPIAGTTPILRTSDTQTYSAIFSLKLDARHSVGFSLDYYALSYNRRGNQNADNPLRSVSPGHVTNKGADHCGGMGLSLGWHWKINSRLVFGLSYIKKSYVGQFRKYRGFEPHHAKNYIPQAVGVGFGLFFTQKLAGRVELLWLNLGNLPGANRTVLLNGKLNPHKRGSDKSPAPTLQDSTIINVGLGYQVNPHLALGIGFSHRIKPCRYSSNLLTHTYRFQTIYDLLTLGANFTYEQHEIFLIFTNGFQNSVRGHMPPLLGGGRFTMKKSNYSLSFSWGYLFNNR